MILATGADSVSARICEALGLKKCRTLNLRLDANSVVTVNATVCVEKQQLGGVAEVLETSDYVLVKRDELRRLESDAAKWRANGQA